MDASNENREITNLNTTEKTKIKDLFKSDKGIKIIVIIGLAGMVLIFASSLFRSDEKESIKAEISSEFDTDAYRVELESRLADIISHIDGAGKTGVMINLEAGREYIYAQNLDETSEESSDRDTNKKSREYFTVKGSQSSSEPLLIRINEPKVCGVIVVCQGGDKEYVKQAIIDAVCGIFNITKSKVSVNKINN